MRVSLRVGRLGVLLLSIAGIVSICAFGLRERDLNTILGRFEKHPYLQVWSGESIEVRGLILTPEYRAAMAMARYHGATFVPNSGMLDSLKESERSPGALQVRIRLASKSHVQDARDFFSTDVIAGKRENAGNTPEIWLAQDFRLDRNIWLRVGNAKISPSAVLVEQATGLDNGRELWVSFRLGKSELSELENASRLELSFDLSALGAGWAELTWPAKAYQENS